MVEEVQSTLCAILKAKVLPIYMDYCYIVILAGDVFTYVQRQHLDERI